MTQLTRQKVKLLCPQGPIKGVDYIDDLLNDTVMYVPFAQYSRKRNNIKCKSIEFENILTSTAR